MVTIWSYSDGESSQLRRKRTLGIWPPERSTKVKKGPQVSCRLLSSELITYEIVSATQGFKFIYMVEHVDWIWELICGDVSALTVRRFSLYLFCLDK